MKRNYCNNIFRHFEFVVCFARLLHEVERIVDCVPRAAWWRLWRYARARAVFTRVTSLPCRSKYTRRFVTKLVEKVSLRASAKLAAGSQVSGSMDILPVEAGGKNISPDFVAEAQLAPCSSTRKHAMRLFPPVWTQ